MSSAVAEIDCVVYVRGARFADTGADYAAGAPTVLEGLDVVWGRDSPLDQPAAATCSFEVRDAGADADFLTLLHVGDPVEVLATVGGLDPTGANVAVDGSFESAAPVDRLTWTAGEQSWALDPAGRNGRAYSGQSTHQHAGAAPQTVIAPAPWAANARGWDLVPVAKVGDLWTVRLHVKPAVATAVIPSLTLTMCTLDTPVKAAAVARAGQSSTVTRPAGGWDTTQWVTLEVTQAITAGMHAGPGCWVGAILTVPAYPWTAAAGSWAAHPGSWTEALPAWLADDLEVVAPASASSRVEVFAGRITDLDAGAAGDAVAVKVIAVDGSAELANDVIGMPALQATFVLKRLQDIQAYATAPYSYDVDPWPRITVVSYLDVDAQAVWTLLSDIATSTGALLWPAFTTARGFYLWFEDVGNRAALAQLALAGGVVVITGARPTPGIQLSACDVLRDPLQLVQNVADVLTVVDVSWLEQTLDDQGVPAPTERRITARDDDATKAWGVRRASVSTQLTRDTDAETLAGKILARSDGLGWHAGGLTWDLNMPAEPEQTHTDAALSLLGGRSRIGLALTVVDAPAWVPGGPALSVYVDGGTYHYEGGRWTLELNVTRPAGAGKSVRWRELDPAWQWQQFDPAIDWIDLWGVAAPAPGQAA